MKLLLLKLGVEPPRCPDLLVWVLGVPGVPGIGSLKCSLNHLNRDPTESNICCRNLKPSDVTVMYS